MREAIDLAPRLLHIFPKFRGVLKVHKKEKEGENGRKFGLTRVQRWMSKKGGSKKKRKMSELGLVLVHPFECNDPLTRVCVLVCAASQFVIS